MIVAVPAVLIPPPQELDPVAELPLTIFPRMVTFCEAQIPPPSPLPVAFPTTTLSSISVRGSGVASLIMRIPPPSPPLHAIGRLFVIVFLCISGEPNSLDNPRPRQARLFEMILPVTVGEEFLIHIPPPYPKPGVSKPDLPFSTVNPLSTEERPSPEMNFTTESA